MSSPSSFCPRSSRRRSPSINKPPLVEFPRRSRSPIRQNSDVLRKEHWKRRGWGRNSWEGTSWDSQTQRRKGHGSPVRGRHQHHKYRHGGRNHSRHSRNHSRHSTYGDDDGSVLHKDDRPACRFDWHCEGPQCWYLHPHGRRIDECAVHLNMTDDPEVVSNKEFDEQELLEESFANLKGTQLFFDLYHPSSRVRSHDLRLHTVQQRFAAFAGKLRNKSFEGISLQIPSSGHWGPTHVVKNAATAPYFISDIDVNGLVVKNVPPAMTMWDIYDTFQSSPGFLTAAIMPPSDALMRDCYVRFDSKQSLEESLCRFGSKFTLTCEVLSSCSQSTALVLPPEMSSAERIRKDVHLSAQIVKRLDALMDLPQSATETLLRSERPLQTQLDLQIMYLRCVHSFCFYAAEWCSNDWCLRRRCGPVVLRCMGPLNSAGEWSDAHDLRVEAFLRDVACERPLLPSFDHEPLLSRMEVIVKEKTSTTSDAKKKCEECGKNFKSVHHVRKHFGKAHAAILDRLRQEALHEMAQQAFFAKPLGNSTLRKLSSANDVGALGGA